ncbi:hypothetical protein Desde_3208 [Desulfitobacterium dehalogenans ATCC 51507]|uniref:Uncharacterized protein n=1 Tax=Desulfitobacterium dehalogenans (strain ATCC 51507 / DSM 9161 / JW/IU-DC1) TaxID=756499 RepID=I4AC14_DESDJ|nr:hypothetical protein Desde_3208 [Desulfitobacterium dehalogenans ATCC 51507]
MTVRKIYLRSSLRIKRRASIKRKSHILLKFHRLALDTSKMIGEIRSEYEFLVLAGSFLECKQKEATFE